MTSCNHLIEEPDNRLLECAEEAKSHYIVSGVADILRLKEFRSVRIVAWRIFYVRCKGRNDSRRRIRLSLRKSKAHYG